eukprot:TRINITY_DN1760_c0_g1_i1.p1 TRINITY_DN1760_c0_g1~~TRINITY_DN1760_c0_g1_i1.p1  ORF type:complete len:289 (-),score=48.23 TRINITY_DN1760_c0_g1_i1:107-919(-)
MAVLSTAPGFAAICAGISIGTVTESIGTDSSRFSEIGRAAAVAEELPQRFIFSTEEVKVNAGLAKGNEVRMSVPRFCAAPAAPKQHTSIPPTSKGVLLKPPGLHIRPPPGLSRQIEGSPAIESKSEKLLSSLPAGGLAPDPSLLLGLATPLFLTSSAILSTGFTPSANEGDGYATPSQASTCNEDKSEDLPARQLPLPVLLGSRPQALGLESMKAARGKTKRPSKAIEIRQPEKVRACAKKQPSESHFRSSENIENSFAEVWPLMPGKLV